MMTGLPASSPRPSVGEVTVLMSVVFWSLVLASPRLHANPSSPATSHVHGLPLNSTATNGPFPDSSTNATNGGALRWPKCTAHAPAPSCPCDVECPLPDGCCYDYAEFCTTAEDSLHYEDFPPVQTKHVKSEQFSCAEVKGERYGYLLVSTCGEDRAGADASRACRGGDGPSALSISDVAVTSLASGVSYRNIHCAVCNDESADDLRAWPVRVACDTAADYDAALAKLRRGPGALRGLNCDAGVRPPLRTGRVGTPVPRGCTRLALTRCPVKPGSTNSTAELHAVATIQGHIPPISILLDFGSSSHVRVVREETVVAQERVTCPAGHVFDPFASRCRRLFCADGYVLADGRCVLAPAQGRAGNPDIEIHVTRTSCGNNTAPDCLGCRNETSYCLANFLGIDLKDITPATMIHPKTGLTTGVCPYSFLMNSNKDSFQTLWTHLLLPWSSSPAANFEKCRDSGVWSTNIERKTNRTIPSTACELSPLNASEYSRPGRYNSTGAVNRVRDPYPSGHVAIRATFDTEGTTFSRTVELETCDEVAAPACALIHLNRSLFRELEADDAGGSSVVYIPTGRVFTGPEYRDTGDGRLELCSFLESNGTRPGTITTRFFGYSDAQTTLSLVGNVVSMVAGGATFLTYFVFDVLRNHATCCIMNLVASLFLAQLLLLLTGSAVANPAGCTMVAALGHYFWLANVFWAGVLAYDLNRTFARESGCVAGRACGGAGGPSRPRLRTYALLAWGGSFAIVVPCLVISLCDCTELPIWYGNSEVCWIGNGQSILVAFAAPLACILLANFLLFVRTVRSIRRTNRETQANVTKHVGKLRLAREELLIYVKISVLMGFTWSFGFAAAMSDQEALWYVFIVLNSLQGVLVFLSFVCKRRVRLLWREAFCGEAPRQRSYSLGVASSSASATRTSRV